MCPRGNLFRALLTACVGAVAFCFAPQQARAGGACLTTISAHRRMGTVCPEFNYEYYGATSLKTCDLRRVESYRMEVDGQGHALIPLMLDKRRMMIVDTGGARSTLYSSVVKELHMPTMEADKAALTNMYKSGSEVAFNGYVSDTVAIAPSVSFGILTFASPTFSVIEDSRTPPLADNEVAGSLGPSHLMTFDVEFDFAADRFNLYLQNHCPGRVVYWAKDFAAIPFMLSSEGHIALDAQLDGKTVKAVLDSGAPFSSIDEYVAAGRFHVTSQSDGDKEGPLAVHRFKKLAIGNVEVENPEMIVVPDLMGAEAAQSPPEVLLGLRELSRLHIFIEYSHSMLYFTLADGSTTQQP